MWFKVNVEEIFKTIKILMGKNRGKQKVVLWTGEMSIQSWTTQWRLDQWQAAYVTVVLWDDAEAGKFLLSSAISAVRAVVTQHVTHVGGDAGMNRPTALAAM